MKQPRMPESKICYTTPARIRRPSWNNLKPSRTSVLSPTAHDPLLTSFRGPLTSRLTTNPPTAEPSVPNFPPLCSCFLFSVAAPSTAALIAAVATLSPLGPFHEPGSWRSRNASAAPASTAALIPRSQRLRLRDDARW
jgi:hypothetical protein